MTVVAATLPSMRVRFRTRLAPSTFQVPVTTAGGCTTTRPRLRRGCCGWKKRVCRIQLLRLPSGPTYDGVNRLLLSWSHSPDFACARWPPPLDTDSEQTRIRYGSRSCLSVNRPLPLVRARTRFSSETSTGRPRSENRMPLTSALGIGVPLGPVTWPVTVPFVGGGLGRRSALGALVLAASGFGGALK